MCSYIFRYLYYDTYMIVGSTGSWLAQQNNPHIKPDPDLAKSFPRIMFQRENFLTNFSINHICTHLQETFSWKHCKKFMPTWKYCQKFQTGTSQVDRWKSKCLQQMEVWSCHLWQRSRVPYSCVQRDTWICTTERPVTLADISLVIHKSGTTSHIILSLSYFTWHKQPEKPLNLMWIQHPAIKILMNVISVSATYVML